MDYNSITTLFIIIIIVFLIVVCLNCLTANVIENPRKLTKYIDVESKFNAEKGYDLSEYKDELFVFDHESNEAKEKRGIKHGIYKITNNSVLVCKGNDIDFHYVSEAFKAEHLDIFNKIDDENKDKTYIVTSNVYLVKHARDIIKKYPGFRIGTEPIIVRMPSADSWNIIPSSNQKMTIMHFSHTNIKFSKWDR